MVKTISQSTFDEVVKENMDEFGMSRKEALEEAVQQFETQGVNLEHIVTTSSDECHAVLEAITTLSTLCKDDVPDEEKISEQCCIIRAECRKEIAHRVLATKHQAYPGLVKAIDLVQDCEVKATTILALAALLQGNPDPLEARGSGQLVLALKSEQAPLVKAALEALLNGCVKHEQNRQNLVRGDLLVHLDKVFSSWPIEVTRIWEALVQDDDIRVPFGEAHNHARAIVEDHEGLKKLSEQIKGNKSLPTEQLRVLMSCLSSLVVRNEYCQAVLRDGVLTALLELLIDPDQNKDIVKESLRVIKSLAGNDEVKKDVGASSGLQIIVNCISKKMSVKAVCFHGCSAISALVLRTPDNAKQVMEAGGAQLIIQILKLHMDNAQCVNACASAIRNIVSRSPELRQEFVELGVEGLLTEGLKKHPSAENSINAALRDLALDVHLKEEWTGEKGGLK